MFRCINTSKTKFPFSIQVSAFGYKTEVIEITSKDQEVNVILKENTALDEVEELSFILGAGPSSIST